MKPILDFWSEVKSVIDIVSNEYDQLWSQRKRVLNSKLLVLFIFKAVLSKNKQGYGSILAELWDECTENNNISLPQVKPVAASSICEARQKLPEEIFIKMNSLLLEKRNELIDPVTWQGHRVFGVDGSKVNLPRELLEKGYALPNLEGHYPQGLLSCLYNLGDGTIHDFILTPPKEKDERMCAIDHMENVNPGDILVFDRGYFSYFFLYKSLEKGVNIICRLQCGTVNKKVQAFLDGEETDAVIDYYPSSAVKSHLKKRGYNLDFKKIPLRLIKYTIASETYVCATTLLGDEYTPESFALIYHGRWGIEELYKISKQFINVEDFHSQTERGVKQELYAHLLLINIGRFFEFDADNTLSKTKSDYATKISGHWQAIFNGGKKLKINFKNCLLVVNRHLYNLVLAGCDSIKTWVPKAISSIASVYQKIRPNRHYPRISHKPRNKWGSYGSDFSLTKA